MRLMAVKFLACVGAVVLCAALDVLPGVTALDMGYAATAGAVLALIYLTLRPVVKLLLGIFNLFTLGLLYVLLDAWLVQLCSWVMRGNFHVDSFWWALTVSLAVNAARGIFGGMLKRAKK